MVGLRLMAEQFARSWPGYPPAEQLPNFDRRFLYPHLRARPPNSFRECPPADRTRSQTHDLRLRRWRAKLAVMRSPVSPRGVRRQGTFLGAFAGCVTLAVSLAAAGPALAAAGMPTTPTSVTSLPGFF